MSLQTLENSFCSYLYKYQYQSLNATETSEFLDCLIDVDLISLMYSSIPLFTILSFPKHLMYFQKYNHLINCISECSCSSQQHSVEEIYYK